MLRPLAVLGILALASAVLAATFFLQDEDRERLTQAQEMMASGRFGEARDLLEQIAGDPVHSLTALEGRLLRIRALTLGGEPREAAEAARQLGEILPSGHPALGRTHALLAEAFEALGRQDEAARVYAAEAAMVLGEGHRSRVAGYYLSLAEALEKGRPSSDPLKPAVPPDPGAAADMYQRALQIMSGGKVLARVTLPRARNLVAASRGAEAAQELAQLLEDKGLEEVTESEARYLRARALMLVSDFAGARMELEKLLALPGAEDSPYGPAALILQGEATLALGGGAERLKEGVASWRRFLEKYPDREEASQVRGRIAEALFGTGLADEAIPAFEALAGDERAEKTARARALFGIGECEQKLQHFDRARQAFRRYLVAYPDDARVPAAQGLLPELLLEKARARRTAKDEAGAVQALREYLEEFPLSDKAATIAVEVGLVLRGMKDSEQAGAAFLAARERYRSHDPEQAGRAGLMLGVVEEEDRQDLEKAAEAYREVVERFQGTRAAEAARARLSQMEAVELGLEVPRLYAPGEPTEVQLTTRNLAQVTFRVYRLDARDYFERRATLDGAADIEVALVKSDHSFDFSLPDYRRYRKDRLPVLIGLEAGKPLAEGAYLVAVEAEERRSVVLLLVSSIRVVVKESPHEVFCWVTDALSGEPREGVNLLVRGAEVSETITTGKDGVARLLHPAPRGRCEVLGVHGGGVAPGLAAEPEKEGQEGLAPRVAFSLDRPLYRPGGEVRYRLLLRAVEKGIFVTPEQVKVPCRLLDPQGRQIASEDLVTAAFGTVHGSFDLPPEGPVGDYTLQVEFAKATFNETVVVRAYRKPEYAVEVRAKTSVVRPGDEVEMQTDVSYFFGGPLKQASYEWRAWSAPHVIDRTRYLSHAWYLQATAAEDPQAFEPGYQLVATGAGSLDNQGRATFSFRTTTDSSDSRYLVEVMVKDTTGQWVSGVGSAYAGPVDRFAVVLTERRTLRAGDRADVRVVTRALDHQARDTRGRLLALRARPGADGRPTLERTAEAAVDTGLEGEARVRLELTEAGDYVLRFEGEDARGAPVVGETGVVVTGERPDLAKEALLRFEKEVYRGGETAQMHLSLPEAGRPVLLTFEGERILAYQILRPERASEVIPLPLGENLAPNVVVAVAAPWKDKLLTSEDRVVVLRYLEVEVEPERSEARPGDQIQLRVRTRDQAGKAVPAAVALRAVDGALRNLGGRATTDPRFVFNRDTRPHLVRTGSSFLFRFEGRTTLLDPDLVSLKTEESAKEALEKLNRDYLAELAQGAVVMAPDTSIMNGIELSEELEVADDDGRPADSRNATAGLGGGAGGKFAGRSGGRRELRAHGGGARADKLADAPAAEPAPNMDRDLYSLTLGEKPKLGAMFASNFHIGGIVAEEKRKSVEAYGLFYRSSPAGGDLPLVAPELRERFLDVAGWWPDVVTDEEGQALLTLELPDNLTTWDLLAAGATRGVSVGQGAAAVRTSKDVLIRLERPRFLTSRDEVSLPAVVHSNLDRGLAFRMELRSLDPGILELAGMSEASFELPPRGVARRDFLLRARTSGQSTVEGQALSGVASDALKVGLPVVAFGEPWTHAATEELVDSVSFSFALEGSPVAGSQVYGLLVQAGMEADVLEGLQFLLAYPYGCLEQTLHRFVPAMILAEALRAAGRPPLLEPAKVRELVRRGLGQIRSFQVADGGFSYWPQGSSDAWATALALEALVHGRNYGHDVGVELLTSAVRGARNLVQTGGQEADARAALLLALMRAGDSQDALLNSLFRERSALSVPGLSRLLLAAAAAGRPAMVQGLFEELKGRRSADREAEIPFAGRGPGHWHNSSLEATALALLAFKAAGAGPGETEGLVQAVRQGLRRRHGGTKAVALALEALATHVAQEGRLGSAATVRVRLNGEEVASGQIGGGSPLLRLDLPVDRMTPGKHQVLVQKDGGTPATCRLLLRHVLPAAKVEAGGNVLELARRIVPFQDPDRKKEPFKPGYTIVKPESRPLPEDPPALDQAVAGWKVTVELRLKAREEVSYLVLEDPQIAGLEVIESGVRGSFDRWERREASMAFFRNRLRKGEELTITYPCYVIHQGRFSALPARVEEMYAPERWGRSPSSDLLVVPDPSLLARVPPRVPTPDEAFQQGLEAFAEERYEDAVRDLGRLLADCDLEEEVHDRILGCLLRSYLRLERWRDAVKAREELQLRNPGKESLSPTYREKLGRAFLAIEDPYQARSQFQAVLLDAFSSEAEVADTVRQQGQPERAAQHQAEVLLRYPSVGLVTTRQRMLADWWLEIPDSGLGERAGLLPPLHRVRWKDAFASYLSVMAWHPQSALAEDAGFRRVALLARLGLLDPLVAECGRYLGRHPDSGRADEVTYLKAQALFRQGRYPEAAEQAELVWSREWPRPRESGTPVPGPSPYRDQAGYLLGKVAHVNGDYSQAVAWYGRVRERVPDARQSWDFFTTKELRVQSLLRAQPEEVIRLSFEAKNLDRVRVQVYPVDLSVLFAVKKSFDLLATAELAGIRPADELVVTPDLPPFSAGMVEAELGKRPKGAYLLVLRGGERSAGCLLLVSSASLTVQRDGTSVRVYLVDGAGKPLPGARVKLGHGGRIFHSGETDERGMLDAPDPGQGTITVVAEKGDEVAVGADAEPPLKPSR